MVTVTSERDKKPMMIQNAGGVIGRTLVSQPTRIHLCGRLTVRIGGARVEHLLPGRQGKLLLAFLIANRARWVSRPEMLQCLWPDHPPPAADAALAALLAKLRKAIGAGLLVGRNDLRLQLPPDAWVDLDVARSGLQRAESALRRQDWAATWGGACVASHVCGRGFLQGLDDAWVLRMREEVATMLVRAHECIATAGLAVGGAELPSAERAARTLIAVAPFRESGYRALMQVLAQQQNFAEALMVYERLRIRLREELGSSPSPATQQLHGRLLAPQAFGLGAVRPINVAAPFDPLGTAGEPPPPPRFAVPPPPQGQ